MIKQPEMEPALNRFVLKPLALRQNRNTISHRFPDYLRPDGHLIAMNYHAKKRLWFSPLRLPTRTTTPRSVWLIVRAKGKVSLLFRAGFGRRPRLVDFSGWIGCLVTCSDSGGLKLLRLVITGRDWFGGDLVTSRAGQRGPG